MASEFRDNLHVAAAAGVLVFETPAPGMLRAGVTISSMAYRSPTIDQEQTGDHNGSQVSDSSR
jgi:hypothetical protein